MQPVFTWTRKGFMLMELLVVVVILGILVAMAIPRYARSVRRAELAEGLSHGKSIYDAAVRYLSVNSVAPTAFNQLDVGFTGTNIASNVFNDVNFTYTLTSDGVTAESDKGDYTLHFIFPSEDSNGVYAPIACCPGDSWMCKTSGKVSTAAGMPSGCREIK